MTLTRQDLVNRLRQEHPTGSGLKLGFDSCRIEVQTSHPELTQALAEYFQPFVVSGPGTDILITCHEAPEPDLGLGFRVKPPEPGKSKIKEEYCDLRDGRVVRKRLTGMHFVFGGSDHCCVGPCLNNVNQVVNFINNRFIQDQLHQGALLGHAAGVSLNGRGLALAGFSGMGKSTLALKMVEKGAVFVSNDRLLVSPRGNGLIMRGVAKLPRINPGTALNNPCLVEIIPENDLERFSSLGEEALWNLEQKYDVPIDVCFGQGRFKLSAPMNGLFILNWSRRNEPLRIQEVNLESRRDLLPAFMKESGLFFLPSEGHETSFSEQAYLDLLTRCVAIEAVGGVDFDRARKACLHFLEQGRVPE
jgi:HprK-related kinase B